MDLGIAERVALVTGAGRGIGRQICLTLGEEGVRVAVNDLFQERADAVAEEIRGVGGQAMGVAGDVTDGDSVQAMVRRVVDEWGAVDILVNNAGIPVITDPNDTSAAAGSFFAQSDRAQWDRTMGLITYGVLNCSRAVVEGMSERRWGRIVNIVSDAGRVGEPRLVAYSQAKAGVVGFSKALAKEVGRFCVTVNCVAPATTETDATKAWLAAQGERIMRGVPAGERAGASGPACGHSERGGVPGLAEGGVDYGAGAEREWWLLDGGLMGTISRKFPLFTVP